MRADHVVVDDLIESAEQFAYSVGHRIDTATTGLMVQVVLQRLTEALVQLEDEQGSTTSDGVVVAREYVEQLAQRGLE